VCAGGGGVLLVGWGRRGGLFVRCNIFRDMQVTTPSPVYILIYDIQCSEEGCLLPATWRWETEYTHRLLASNWHNFGASPLPTFPGTNEARYFSPRFHFACRVLFSISV
jgi:hypothetical protein